MLFLRSEKILSICAGRKEKSTRSRPAAPGALDHQAAQLVQVGRAQIAHAAPGRVRHAADFVVQAFLFNPDLRAAQKVGGLCRRVLPAWGEFVERRAYLGLGGLVAFLGEQGRQLGQALAAPLGDNFD